ncbi:MAG: hypothetical protein JNL79_40720 [Myxococcales bacterium]|nr:hypothetical protein [Myxococcales bacterium]
MKPRRSRTPLSSAPALVVLACAAGCESSADPAAADSGHDGAFGVPTNAEDFHVPGTQIGDLPAGAIPSVTNCVLCHESTELPSGPFAGWRGSLMGIAGRDPLFLAQLATANQDAPGVGYYCLRCHVPVSVPSGHASNPKGTSLDAQDVEGVTCAFCHAMVDPRSKVDADVAVLGKLGSVPTTFGNAQFVLDPSKVWRGPYDIPDASPPVRKSDFVKTSEMCGTCHDVGNPATIRNADGSYAYGPVGVPATNPDPTSQFPLERTFTEWRLSAFARGGVELGGRFGGAGVTRVSTCQDCHMPRAAGKGATFGPERPDLATHEFAGASAWVLRISAKEFSGEIDPAPLLAGAARAEALLAKAATLEVSRVGGKLRVKVVNESGHKLPTGHIEGRRAWLGVRWKDAAGTVVKESGRYDPVTAELDESTTMVFEMHVGLSPVAAGVTGYPAGVTTHMSLADVVVKDTRIPPRGYDPKAFAAAGAAALGHPYADGEHWATIDFDVPSGAARAEVTLWYQTVTKHYVEALRAGNKTDAWGEKLYALWLATDKDPPFAITTATQSLD